MTAGSRETDRFTAGDASRVADIPVTFTANRRETALGAGFYAVSARDGDGSAIGGAYIVPVSVAATADEAIDHHLAQRALRNETAPVADWCGIGDGG